MSNNYISSYKLTPERENLLWADCIFIFDSSALLSFYSMPAPTRKKIYDSLISPQLTRFWIPGHVKFEYLKNREKVITKPIDESYNSLEKETVDEIEKLVNKLNAKTDELKKRIKNNQYHPHFDDSDIKTFIDQLAILKNEHEKFKVGVRARIIEAKKEIEKLRDADDLLEFFNNLRIGREFLFDEIYQITLEGKHRYEFSIPPGYEDLKDKVGTQIFGDLIIWKQILEFSHEAKKPIIFICNDLKADWCYTENSNGDRRIEAPREELIKEIKDHSGCEFWMYNLPQFLYQANKRWEGTINDEDIAALANVITEAEHGKPSLVLELKPTGSRRINTAYSDRNPIHTGEDGRTYRLVGGLNKPIIHWALTWEMLLKIHNQSSFPAFNIKIEKVNEKWFTTLDSLPKINSLASLDILPLDAEYQSNIEGVSTDADELLKSRIPEALEGMTIKITYQNEQKKTYEKIFRLENASLIEI
jgi:hypothetical protein